MPVSFDPHVCNLPDISELGIGVLVRPYLPSLRPAMVVEWFRSARATELLGPSWILTGSP